MQPSNLLSVVAGAIAVLTMLAGAGIARGNSPPDDQGPESARVEELMLDAVREGDIDALAALLERSVDVNTGIHIRGVCCVTALHVAAARNNPDIATLLIEAGANVNARIPGDGSTPLHWAAAERALETAAALLAAGADMEAADSNRLTPLHMAANRMVAGDGVAQLLVGRGANVNAAADSDERPLHYAVWWSRHRLATALLDAGADVDAMNLKGYTALHFAALRRALDAVEVLVANGATVDPPREGDAPSPLFLAVRSKHEEIALLLIEHGADVGVGVDSGATLLALAEENGLHDVAVRILERDDSHKPENAAALLPAAVAADAYRTVTWLLEDGGDINVKADNYLDDALLHVAAESGSASVARLLLDLGMNPDVRNLDEETPLHSAASSGSHEIVGMLLARGASVDVRARNDMTPLHYAARGREPEAAAVLLAHDADVNARSLAGWTPLHFALLRDAIGHADVETRHENRRRLAETLIGHGADVNARTALAARAPLHLAVLLGNPEIVATILEGDADVNARTRLGGWTPLHLALRCGCAHDDVVTVLRTAGGDDRVSDADADPLPMLSWGMDTVERPDSPDRAWRMEQLTDVISIPVVFAIDEFGSHGSFTAAGEDERLIVEPLGWNSFLEEPAYLTGLIDRDGETRLLWISDTHTRFVSLCRDAESETDHAIFSRWHGGNRPPDIVYMAYDAERGILSEAFVDWMFGERFENEMRERDERGLHGPVTCVWRDKNRYREAFHALQAGTWEWESTFDIDKDRMVLPTRMVSPQVVESSLATLRDLSAVTKVVADSPSRTIVVVEPDTSGHVSGPDGVVLVRDKERDTWRSIYDCHDFEVLHQRGDKLYAVLDEDCTGRYSWFKRIHEIDLRTLWVRRRPSPE